MFHKVVQVALEAMTEVPAASKKRESTEPPPARQPDAKKIAEEGTAEAETPVEQEVKKDSPEETDTADGVRDKSAANEESDKFLNASELTERFPSLPLQGDAPLFGLYFAASWCPDCTAATAAVGTFASAHKKDLQVVYISSDSSEPQMKEYVPSSLLAVPFDCEEERADLKRHFGACASKERETLGMTPAQRKFGIPTLIILGRATGRVVTSGGVEAIMESDGQSIVGKWKSILAE
jgi:nucleoredoxin